MDSFIEIIDDSEPEREAWRMTLQEKRRQRRAATANPLAPDSLETMAHSPVIDQTHNSSVVEASHRIVAHDTHAYVVEGDLVSRNSCLIQGPETRESIVDSSSQIISVHSSDSEDSHIFMIQKLAAFRHTGPPKGSSRDTRSPSICPNPRISSGSSVEIEKSDYSHGPPTIEDATEKATKPIKRKRIPAISSISGITDLQLSRLDNCVACQLRWTARKSVPEKAKHIVACARKRGLVNETLAALVEKALQIISVKHKEPTQNLLKGDISPAKTLLASVQDGMICKKRGRKAIINNTVQDPSRLRPAILGRARDFIDGLEQAPSSMANSAASSHLMIDSTAPEVPAPSDPAEPPLTQAFGKSRLAALRPPATSILAADPPPLSTTDEDRLRSAASKFAKLDFTYPPATRGFARSALAEDRLGAGDISPRPSPPPLPSIHHAASLTVDFSSTKGLLPSASARDGDSVIIIQHSSSPVVVHEETNHSIDFSYSGFVSSVSTNFPEAHEILNQPAPESISNERILDASPWDDSLHGTSGDADGAYLHWEPPPSPPQVPEIEIALRDLPSQNQHDLESLVAKNPGLELPAVTKPKGKRKSKKDLPAEKPGDHPDFEQKMLTRIQSDEALWLRILRYEPIDFEVFMRVAQDAGFAERGLKLILKPFLDKHAVQFYGTDGTIGRSRVKKRHP